MVCEWWCASERRRVRRERIGIGSGEDNANSSEEEGRDTQLGGWSRSIIREGLMVQGL